MTLSDAIGVAYGPVTIAGSGATYTITLARPITQPDRVTIDIANPAIAPFARRLDVLPGDFNDDAKVNTQDLLGVRAEWLGLDGAKPTIFGDINGDGVVDQQDYLDVLAAMGTAPADRQGHGRGLGVDRPVSGGRPGGGADRDDEPTGAEQPDRGSPGVGGRVAAEGGGPAGRPRPRLEPGDFIEAGRDRPGSSWRSLRWRVVAWERAADPRGRPDPWDKAIENALRARAVTARPFFRTPLLPRIRLW